MPLLTNPQFRDWMLAKQPQLSREPRLEYQPTAGTMEGTLGYQASSQMPAGVTKALPMRTAGRFLSSLGTDTPTAALLGGALGGAVGAGTALLRGKNLLRSMMIGTALGGGGAYGISQLASGVDARRQKELSDYQRFMLTKRSFYAAPESGMTTEMVQTRLFADPAIPAQQKAVLLTAIQTLSPEQARQLTSLVRNAAGAGIGALVARFLFGAGVGGTAVAAIAGGLLSARFGARPANAYGQRMDTEYDVFGNRRLLF